MTEAAMDIQPVLIGDLVELRPLREDDREALYAVARDPELWALHPAHDRHEPPVFDAFIDEALASGGALTVIDRVNGAVIGGTRYAFARAGPDEIEIGWTFLARSHWGGATNRDMKRVMLRHAFGSVGTVIFLIGEANLRSRRAIEKIGARLTERRFPAVMAGRVAMHVIYALDRAEFENPPLCRNAR